MKDTFLLIGRSLGRREVDKFNCLLYGEAGVGKTPLCGTLEAYEKTSPCLFLDVDQGTMSLNGTGPRPTVYSVTSFDSMSRIYGLLKNGNWDELAKLVGSVSKQYRSVVIDSGTELASILLRSIVAEDDKNEGVPDQASYLKTQLRFITMYKAFRDLPLSVVTTAGVRDQKDDIAGIVRFWADFSPGLLKELYRFSDLILFMNVVQEDKKWVRYIQTQPTQRFTARDRSDKLASVIKAEKIYFADVLKGVLS